MLAVKLYGPRDLRVEEVPVPGKPGKGQVLVAVTAVGVCGSDLHTYQDGRIGTTTAETPLILGHEFAGVVLAVGEDAYDGLDEPLVVGQRVAIDPATPCYHCEFCEHGHPNLCHRLHFHGLYPDDGALQEQMVCAARSCFPFPDRLSDTAGALLEPLGVALHAVDLAKLKLARSVAVLGCGPIGLLITRLAKLSGAMPIYAFDCYRWRADKALAWGADEAYVVSDADPVKVIQERTHGRGVDVVFEAAWADHSVQQSVDMVCNGGRVMLVGIPSKDEFTVRHSVARRKGLTLVMSRRMKHTYGRAIRLATSVVNLDDLASHHFSLRETPQAYAMNTDYAEGVHKVMIDVASSAELKY